MAANSVAPPSITTDVVQFFYSPTSRVFDGVDSTQDDVRLCGLRGDHIFEEIKRLGMFYESDLLERIYDAIGQCAHTIIDVGANIGNHTIYFSKIMRAKVICIEPNPVALGLLRNNLQLNDVEASSLVVEAALADTPRELYLMQGEPNNLGMAHVTQDCDGVSPPIAARTLDEVLLTQLDYFSERISAIKVDVEGWESRVLRGGLKTIQSHRPLLIVEISSVELKLEIDNMLFPMRYRCLGPFCATPTYIFCPDDLMALRVWWGRKRRRAMLTLSRLLGH